MLRYNQREGRKSAKKKKKRNEGDKKKLSEKERKREKESIESSMKFRQGSITVPGKLRYAPTFRQVTKTLMPESKIKRTNTDTEIKV